MKVKAITVTDTPQRIPVRKNGGVGLRLINEGTTNPFYLGGDDSVSHTGANQGQKIIPGAGTGDDLRNGDEVWVVCETGLTTEVSYSATGEPNA